MDTKLMSPLQRLLSSMHYETKEMREDLHKAFEEDMEQPQDKSLRAEAREQSEE